MKRFYLITTILLIGVSALWSQHANVVWNTPSRNSSESMPCGGGDIGMNIWVEDGDVLFYVSRSGTFDENNCQLKQGRFRLRLSPNPFKETRNFRQELKLKDGYVEVESGGTQIQFWVDVFHPVIQVEIANSQPLHTEVSYETGVIRNVLSGKERDNSVLTNGSPERNGYKCRLRISER